MADGDIHRVEIVGADRRFDVVEGERLLAAARSGGVWLPFECGWGSCGTCKMTLVDGTAELLFPAAPALSERDSRRRRILACQSTARSDLSIKTRWTDSVPPERLAVATRYGTLLQRNEIGPDIWRLRFKLDGIVDFREGQHAIVDLGGGLRRCYSMSNAANGHDTVEFIAKRYAGRPGSETFTSLPRGTTVPIEVPFGDVWVRDSAARVCLVAGGTGIAPILGMLKRLAHDDDHRQIYVFYGANTFAELVCWDEISALVSGLANAELVGALAAPPSGWSGIDGFVTAALASRLGELATADFYAAGPPVMTTAVVSLLGERGVTVDHIHYDSFG